MALLLSPMQAATCIDWVQLFGPAARMEGLRCLGLVLCWENLATLSFGWWHPLLANQILLRGLLSHLNRGLLVELSIQVPCLHLFLNQRVSLFAIVATLCADWDQLLIVLAHHLAEYLRRFARCSVVTSSFYIGAVTQVVLLVSSRLVHIVLTLIVVVGFLIVVAASASLGHCASDWWVARSRVAGIEHIVRRPSCLNLRWCSPYSWGGA